LIILAQPGIPSIVTIEKISLAVAGPVAGPVADLWAEVASQTLAWLSKAALPARDAVLLLPFAALLPPARAAFARAGGWQPRVETCLTLAGSLGPAAAPAPGQCSGDVALDVLTAGNLLRRQAWAQEFVVRDAAGFAGVTQSFVDAAQAVRQAALERAPEAREAYWADLQSRVLVASGPAAREASLLRGAVEWAAGSLQPSPNVSPNVSPNTEACFAHRPSAWIVLRLGGPEALSESLLGHAGVPSLHLWADADEDAPFVGAAQHASLARWLCDDFEAEAQATAAVITQALNDGQAPVALVALDRELVRRVRALLDRVRVPVTDETGWLLATTRAAAGVVARLQAALPNALPNVLPNAGLDARLDWLKAWPAAQADGGVALDALEAHWRGSRHVDALHEALALWAAAQAHLQPLAQAGSLSLKAWLQLLHDHLAADDSLVTMQRDAAGTQVLAALAPSLHAAWQSAATECKLDLPGFIRWVRQTLERTPFLPLPDPGAVVVLMPLTRCFGRPFQHIVIPGADHLHLGATETPPSLISDALAASVGMDHRALRRGRQRQALAQLMRAPRVTLLRRLRDKEETLTDSPDVEWLLLARSQANLPVWPLRPWVPATRTVAALPVNRPMPTAPLLLPARLSASQLEALRQCPYRFFARAVLNLQEPDELEAALQKRDYGEWLHAVLHQFHLNRDSLTSDLAQLRHAANVQTHELDLDPGELLPFRASFEQFVPAYLQWLSEREAAGWRWAEGETDHAAALPGVPGLQLRGRVDRIDDGPDGQQVLDYKAITTSRLQGKVKVPLEDTQLAFYAALLGGGPQVQAAYLSLDDKDAPTLVEHSQVHNSVQALLAGVADEWQRLQAGAAMPALGEGDVCETCEARGLCRRDHWQPA
jgi:ATP-dependent helicase/nuclease subunit B